MHFIFILVNFKLVLNLFFKFSIHHLHCCGANDVTFIDFDFILSENFKIVNTEVFRFWGSFWLPVDPIFHEKSVFVSTKDCITFLLDFEWPFGSILEAFWGPFCIKRRPWGGKGDFSKMSVSRKRELYFGGLGL